jgi:hypothetical protein
MGLFSRKPSHRAQCLAMMRIAARLNERILAPNADAPAVLRLSRPDSRFRYLMFCLSTVQTVCARRMSNPEAVLNEVARNAITAWVSDPEIRDAAFGGPVSLQQAGSDGIACLQDCLNRWPAYLDLRNGGNAHAATGFVCVILFDIESAGSARPADGERLWPLAWWVEQQFNAIDGAFVELCSRDESEL